MTCCLANDVHAGEAPPVHGGTAAGRDGFALRAMCVAGGKTSQDGKRHHPGSRADFVQALEILGKRLTDGACHFELGDRAAHDVQVALLRCPAETWMNVFGHPDRVERQATPSPLFPVEVWHYDCTDGPVECVGYQLNDLTGRRWITFVRVCYF